MKKIQLSIIVLQIIVFTYSVLLSFLYPYIGLDDGYYLAVARDLIMGGSLYDEINTYYCPLTFLLSGISLWFWPSGGAFILWIPYLICIILITFVGFITLSKTLDLLNTLILTLFVTNSILVFGGMYLMNEIPATLFLTLIYKIIIDNEEKVPCFKISVLIAIAFLFKQYSIYVLPTLIIYYFFSNKRKVSISIFFYSTFLISLAILFIYFTRDIELVNLLQQIAGYLPQSENIYSSKFEKIFSYSVFRNLILIFAPILPLLIYKSGISKNNILLLALLIAASTSPLLMRQYDHYFIWGTPLIFLISFKSTIINSIQFKFTLILVMLVSLYHFRKVILITPHYKISSKTQGALIKPLAEQLPAGEKVYIHSGVSTAHYYLNGWKNKSLNYEFATNFNINKILELTANEDSVIVSKEMVSSFVKNGFDAKKIPLSEINDHIYVCRKKM